MSRTKKIRSSLAALALVSASGSAAQASCMLDGREYPEDAQVCSGGLVLYCTNGVWQSNDGQRCDAPSGNYVGPRRPLQERNPEPVPDFYKEKYPELNLR